MTVSTQLYQRVLTATDFSPAAESALRQAVWIARQSGAKLSVAHTLPDLRKAMVSASTEARANLLYGDGAVFQKEIRQESDDRLKQAVIAAGAGDLDVNCMTLLGEAFVELIHAIQADGHDLLVAGSRGLSKWEQFFVGSTAKRLVRACPASVLVVREGQTAPPKVVLAPTDFSDISLKAAQQGLWFAQQSGAEFHLLHVLDSMDVPEDLFKRVPEGESLRDEINAEAKARQDKFLESLGADRAQIKLHMSWGTPWKEVQRLAKTLSADLIAIGAVGRSGIQGVLLGNTAEKILDACDCSILTVKPDGFVSPVQAAWWPLHPKA